MALKRASVNLLTMLEAPKGLFLVKQCLYLDMKQYKYLNMWIIKVPRLVHFSENIGREMSISRQTLITCSPSSGPSSYEIMFHGLVPRRAGGGITFTLTHILVTVAIQGSKPLTIYWGGNPYQISWEWNSLIQRNLYIWVSMYRIVLWASRLYLDKQPHQQQ